MSFRVSVLVSGTGTNLQAILDQLHGRHGIEVVAVASNRPEARALDRAATAGVETAVFEASAHGGREERDLAMADWLAERRVDLVVLAGYMELLCTEFIARFPSRIVNVHPSLLPAFPGIRAIEQALDHGVKVGGVTVHFVDEGVDSGPIILQRAVEVPADRDPAEFESRLHAVEHELLPEAIRLIGAGAVSMDARNPRLVRIERGMAGARRV